MKLISSVTSSDLRKDLGLSFYQKESPFASMQNVSLQLENCRHGWTGITTGLKWAELLPLSKTEHDAITSGKSWMQRTSNLTSLPSLFSDIYKWMTGGRSVRQTDSQKTACSVVQGTNIVRKGANLLSSIEQISLENGPVAQVVNRICPWLFLVSEGAKFSIAANEAVQNRNENLKFKNFTDLFIHTSKFVENGFKALSILEFLQVFNGLRLGSLVLNAALKVFAGTSFVCHTTKLVLLIQETLNMCEEKRMQWQTFFKITLSVCSLALSFFSLITLTVLPLHPLSPLLFSTGILVLEITDFFLKPTPQPILSKEFYLKL